MIYKKLTRYVLRTINENFTNSYIYILLMMEKGIYLI